MIGSGIWVRVGTQNKLLEDMTTKEREEWLGDFEKSEQYVTCIHELSKALKFYHDNISLGTNDDGQLYCYLLNNDIKIVDTND